MIIYFRETDIYIYMYISVKFNDAVNCYVYVVSLIGE